MTGMKRALAASAASLALVVAGVAHGEVFDLKNGPPWCACGATGTITVTADGTALDGDPTFKVVVDITSGAFNLAGKGFDATGFDLDGITTANLSLVSTVGGSLADFYWSARRPPPRTMRTAPAIGTSWSLISTAITAAPIRPASPIWSVRRA